MPRNKNQRGGGGGNRGGHGGGGARSGMKAMVSEQQNSLREGVFSTNQHMFRDRARDGKASEVDVYLTGTVSLLGDLRALTTLKIGETAIVKSVGNASALPNVHMIDLKLNVMGGPIEDETYALFPLLIKNIRRGNTVLRLDQAEGDTEYVLARKGLEKFFDLRYEFISPEQRFDDSKTSVEHHMQKNYVMAGPLKALLEGHKVEVLKTLKANGENVQVSWCQAVQGWVVCSKNVALVAQNKEHANSDAYKMPRFSFAVEMANVWFDKLASIEKEKGAAAIDQLKADLQGKTLVGEYIGSQEHQHLVKYSRVTIIFYAVVENQSMTDCIPCDEAWALFDKWGLDKVAIQTLGEFSEYGALCDALCRVFKDVAKSEIAQEEEGNVLYFIKRPNAAVSAEAKSEVMSLCKLKTLEYRLFRKMREKLRHFYVRSPAEQTEAKEKEVIKKFISEANQLSQEHDLPRPLNYYIQLFKTAFMFCDESQANINTLNNEYVTFSEQLLEYFAAKNKDNEALTSNNSAFFFSPILDVQSNIQYGQGSIQAYDLKSSLEDEERKQAAYQDDDVEETKEPARKPQSAQQAATAAQAEIAQQQQKRKVTFVADDEPLARDKSVKVARTIFVIIPFGVPGSGKSTIKKALAEKLATMESESWSFESVSSDSIRAEQMKPLIDSGKTKKEAFDATARTGPKAYGDAFGRICSNAQTSTTIGMNHVIFLDKNHPANGIKRAVDDIRKNLKGNVTVKKLFLVPDMPAGKSGFANLPFSENYICQLYSWGQNRTDHETLDNSDPNNMLDIQTMFMKMHLGLTFNDQFLMKHQLDGFLRVPMSVESFELPASLLNSFKAMLNTFSGVGQEGNQETNSAFLAELKNNSDVLMQFPDKEMQQGKMLAQLISQKTKPALSRANPESLEEEKKESAPQQQSIRTVRDTNAPSGGVANKNGKSPIFLGIDIECDPAYEQKLGKLFTSAFKQAGEPKQMIEDFQKMVRQQQSFNPWKLPNSHHVTTLFIGGNRKKLQQPQAEFHQEGKEVRVVIRALIYVPDKLVAGICFPDCEIENAFPHLTLMVSQGWAPVMSNTVIQATCGKSGVFEQAYIAAEDGRKPAPGAGVHSAQNINIDKKGRNEVVFVLLREPITFDGRLKSFY